MLWKMVRQTLIAAAVIGAVAAVWQVVVAPGTPASPDNPTRSERVYHHDD